MDDQFMANRYPDPVPSGSDKVTNGLKFLILIIVIVSITVLLLVLLDSDHEVRRWIRDLFIVTTRAR